MHHHFHKENGGICIPQYRQEWNMDGYLTKKGNKSVIKLHRWDRDN